MHAAGRAKPRLAARGARQRPVQPEGGLSEQSAQPQQNAETEGRLGAVSRLCHRIVGVPGGAQQRLASPGRAVTRAK